MPVFKTQFHPHDRVAANGGSPIRILYSPKFDERGVMELVESGKENLYEFIQSHAESCDIHVILERFARGDVSALEKVQGVYGDFSNLPNSYADMLNLVRDAESAFMKMPVEERAKYGHSFERWLTEFTPTLPGSETVAASKLPTEKEVEKVSEVVNS